MRLLGIRLQNVACFDDLSLDFTVEDSAKTADWVVLLGENGTGKSTILQMIGAALLGQNRLVVAGDLDWHAISRNQTVHLTPIGAPACLLGLHLEDGDIGHNPSADSDLRFSASLWGNPEVFPSAIQSIQSGRPELEQYLHGSELTQGWFACGYGPGRRLVRRLSGENGALPTRPDADKPYRFVSLFGDPSRLTDVSAWLSGLYFRTRHESRSDLDDAKFERARGTLKSTLPGVEDIEVDLDQRVWVRLNGSKVPIERLSDGYRGTLAWVGDLIRRLFDAYPASDNPLNERGVVLVDEIDIHLHPKWQRSVVQDVRKLFPKLQFIVTTHSPFIVQDLRRTDKVIVLQRSKRGDTIEATENSVDVQNWSADQILSAYFGLKSGTRGERAIRTEARYQRLLDADASGSLTDKQSVELHKLQILADRVPIGDTPTEAEFYRIADKTIEALKRKREQLEAERRNGGTEGPNGTKRGKTSR